MLPWSTIRTKVDNMANIDEVTREHFETTPIDESAPPPDTESGTRDAAEIGSEAAGAAWAEAARDVLTETARHYHAVVTYKALGTRVQDLSGVRTSQLMQHWIGDVLNRVARECRSRDEPNLASLCVNAQGSVGLGYAASTGTEAGAQPEDLDNDAAKERLACHRHFEATNLPADGGVHALTSQVAASRSRSRKAAQAARPVETCPTCHIAPPANGICDNCA